MLRRRSSREERTPTEILPVDIRKTLVFGIQFKKIKDVINFQPERVLFKVLDKNVSCSRFML